MSRKTKGIIISILAILAIVFVIVGAFRLVDYLSWETYSSARKQCESVLKKHRVKMEEIALDALASGAKTSGEYKGHYYSTDIEDGLVTFDVDSQGMATGGQYWRLVYTKHGMFRGETESYVSEDYHSFVEKAEKLDEHWWYYWIDYDMTERSYQ